MTKPTDVRGGDAHRCQPGVGRLRWSTGPNHQDCHPKPAFGRSVLARRGYQERRAAGARHGSSGPLTQMGFKVELAPYDDQANPDVGVANANRIII